MLSIVIPTYEQQGHGPFMLAKLFESIRMQVFDQDKPEIEIVIADNSLDNKVWKVCEHYLEKEKMPIAYYSNREHIGHCENFNFALDRAKGTHIKLMCQDDMFLEKRGLQTFWQCLKLSNWCVSDSIHIDEHDRPKYRKSVQYNPNEWEKNITGMPSVIGFKANHLRFDVRLRTYCDLFFYRQLYDMYGMPWMIRSFTIGQRFWPHSASRTLPKRHEEDRLLIKHILNDLPKEPNVPGVRRDKINRIS